MFNCWLSCLGMEPAPEKLPEAFCARVFCEEVWRCFYDPVVTPVDNCAPFGVLELVLLEISI